MKSMIWNPFIGCEKTSIGCKYCYVHMGHHKKGQSIGQTVLTSDFEKPLKKNKNNAYTIASNTMVYLCFRSDFFIESMDKYRDRLWEIIRIRHDLKFLFLTKRIHRFKDVLPKHFDGFFDHVEIGVSIETQENADLRIPFLIESPFKTKHIILQPLLENIDLTNYLSEKIQSVTIGGEAHSLGRPLDYQWVLNVRDQCEKSKTNFSFRQAGSHFIKDGISYKIPFKLLSSQAKKADIDLNF